MGKKLGKQKIVLEFDDKDFCTIWGYQKFLTKHLKAGDKIPARVLNKFFSMFTVEENRLKQELKKRSEKVKKLTVERYTKDKDYIFSKKLPFSIQIRFGNKKYPETKSICCLSDMLNRIFTDIENNMIQTYQKESLITLVNDSITDYFSLFKGNTKNLFSKYKRDAIIGFIVYKFGFHPSKETKDYEDQDPPNQVLHQAVKYHTSKNKKKSK